MWYPVLKREQLKEGEIRKLAVGGKDFDLTLIGDHPYAFDDTCTHEECSLSEGFLVESLIECACHGAQFDLKTGEVLRLPATRPIKTYPVKVENGVVFVEV